jgi:hypothetical protein
MKAKDAMLDELKLFLEQKVFEQITNPTEEKER